LERLYAPSIGHKENEENLQIKLDLYQKHGIVQMREGQTLSGEITMTTKFDLKDRIVQLLHEEPFFAHLSRNINKVASDAIPTAGVRVTEDGRYEMIYNNEFFESLPRKQQLGVIKHELYHLVFEHCSVRKVEGVSPRLQNIAADLAINSHLAGQLPENCCMPGVGPFADYPSGESFEWYLAKMMDEQEEQEGEGEGEGGEGSPSDDSASDNGEQTDQMSGDHSQWSQGQSGEAQTAAEQIAKQRLKKGIKRAAQAAASGRIGGGIVGPWGSISSATQKDILKSLETHVDWKKILRYFIKTSQRANKKSSIKTINRRYPYIQPGRRVKRTAKIAIAVDQSGSVSDRMLSAFFAEMNKLAKLATFIVIPFDHEVDESKIYEWKKGKSHPTERVLQGGTCFNAPTEWANKNSVDGLIILTDLAAPKPIRSKSQRMWMTTKEHASRPYFTTQERVIVIDV